MVTMRPIPGELDEVILNSIVEELNRMAAGGDAEGLHCSADELLLDVVRILGHQHIADAWTNARNRVGFWYA